ncbi:hypothetical protein GCM10020358_10830 [Amorphoplanes nipponensis]|uniref:Annexin A11 n=1 Tax=Actinoplanes nipponensis TaxID=135950 RepID=A0A919JN88_9ACTN|nr:hypothetical protein [Actinoplanes nipponensis]GIE52291.1 hypothetical protein Ani05nite_58250 [Actinoplanes nipponensis]
MSNPVAPPPPAGDGFPPPANQGFGSAPAPGQPYGAPPAEGQPYGAPPVAGQPGPGQPYGDPAQQGFGSPAAFPPEPKKKSAVGRLVLRIVGAIVVFVIVLVVKDAFFGDKAKDAAVGDCVASSEDVKVDEETEANAKVVDCGSADAAFTVVGRVEGESDTKSKSCEKFFKENEEYYVYSSTAGKGYLLCLRPKAS